MVRFDERHLHSASVRYGSRDVHRKGMYPFRVNTQHVDDQIRSSLRTVDRANLPLGRKVGVVIGMRMAAEGTVSTYEIRRERI